MYVVGNGLYVVIDLVDVKFGVIEFYVVVGDDVVVFVVCIGKCDGCVVVKE